jgi:hypothetical protein
MVSRGYLRPAAPRRGYNDAASSVAGMVHRYGEAKVLSWLTAGLPK